MKFVFVFLGGSLITSETDQGTNEKARNTNISIMIVIADPGIFIRIIRSYPCTINCIAGIAT